MLSLGEAGLVQQALASVTSLSATRLLPPSCQTRLGLCSPHVAVTRMVRVCTQLSKFRPIPFFGQGGAGDGDGQTQLSCKRSYLFFFLLLLFSGFSFTPRPGTGVSGRGVPDPARASENGCLNSC